MSGAGIANGPAANVHLRPFDRRGIVLVIAAIIYFSPAEKMPDPGG